MSTCPILCKEIGSESLKPTSNVVAYLCRVPGWVEFPNPKMMNSSPLELVFILRAGIIVGSCVLGFEIQWDESGAEETRPENDRREGKCKRASRRHPFIT